MPEPLPYTFEAPLEAGGPSFMPTQVVQVPSLVLEALGGKGIKRVTGTVNGYPVRLGLLCQAGGGRYLMLNKDLCRSAGIQVGQRVTVALAPDPQPDHIDLPEELTEALAAWPEAEAGFQRLTAGMRRAVAYHVASARQAETRARRTVELVTRLAAGRHPFRS
ncbi:YdeI/OmpD-associated family protein [Hymenobacter weizhouensis]|uniref:YdeI/OmpD-associated family protein n=1 Tax=Hymenobacter sp. YIM 151500-1 TaxID=2987689 RepID=UPI002226E664|nr:YdeI/OmpD-associated family protein [Hymenobacter sp. YIM 151500-1]UYZ62700.1 YdeI/OmpD-associated family protein [Hymenobacter sp. YIM 151500-1]